MPVSDGDSVVTFFFNLSSDEHDSEVVVGLIKQIPVELPNAATLPTIELLPTTSFVEEAVVVPIPTLPLELITIDGVVSTVELPVAVVCVNSKYHLNFVD